MIILSFKKWAARVYIRDYTENEKLTISLKMLVLLVKWGLFTWPNQDNQKLVRIWQKNLCNDEPYFFNLTKIHDTDKHQLYPQQNMLVQSDWTGPPAPALKLALAGIPSQPCFTPLQEKKHQSEVRRTLDVKLRFVGFIRFVNFNFGHVQLLRFVVVMVQSYSFGHLDSVKWITLQ